MKTLGIVLAVFFSLVSLSGCKTQSIVAANSSSAEGDYDIVGLVTLNVGDGVKCQATIENLKDDISAVPPQKPRSKLLIRNLSTNRIIYQEEVGDSSLSYPGFDVGRGAALVVRIQGGSGDGIRVYEVTQSDARVVLAEGYRAAAIAVPNDELGGNWGFLIVDSESGTQPLAVKRYQYDGNSRKYVLNGKGLFSEFIRSMKTQFEPANGKR